VWLLDTRASTTSRPEAPFLHSQGRCTARVGYTARKGCTARKVYTARKGYAQGRCCQVGRGRPWREKRAGMWHAPFEVIYVLGTESLRPIVSPDCGCPGPPPQPPPGPPLPRFLPRPLPSSYLSPCPSYPSPASCPLFPFLLPSGACWLPDPGPHPLRHKEATKRLGRSLGGGQMVLGASVWEEARRGR